MATEATFFPSTPITLHLDYGTVTPPDGEPRTYDATDLLAYYDAYLALAWIQHARVLVNRLKASIDAPPGVPSRENARRQVEMVYLVFNAIAQAYNALNIVWWTDPQARALYRTWISGAPAGNTPGQIQQSEFYAGNDFKADWFGNGFPWPQIAPAAAFRRDVDARRTAPLGIIPTAALDAFARYGGANANNPAQWVQGAGLYIDADNFEVRDPRELPVPVDAGSTMRNRAFAWMSSRTTMPSSANYVLRVDSSEEDVWQYQEDPPPAVRDYAGTSNSVVRSRFLHAVMFNGGIPFGSLPAPPDGAQVDPRNGGRPMNMQGDWNLFAYDESLFGAPLKIANPLADYASWAHEWITALEGRTPVQIITAARLYVLYLNGGTIRNNIDAIERIVAEVPSLAADVRRPDRNADAVFTAIGAVGAGVAAVGGVPGALVGLALGVVAGAGKIINALIDHGIGPNHHRDDLGQFKPYFVRAMLSGSIRAGAEQPPALRLAAPPGWVRPIILSAFVPMTDTEVDGEALLARMGVTYSDWVEKLSVDEQNRLLAAAGITDPAAQAEARFAIARFGSSQHRQTSSGGGVWPWLLGGALVVGAVAASRRK